MHAMQYILWDAYQERELKDGGQDETVCQHMTHIKKRFILSDDIPARHEVIIDVHSLYFDFF